MWVLEVAPNVVTDGRVAVVCLGDLGQSPHHGYVFGRDRLCDAHVDHVSEATRRFDMVRAMARPRGARSRADAVIEMLAKEYPDAKCALVHDNPFQLLAATILSAQSTDVMVNTVTPTLFERYPSPADLAAADPEELETIIHSTGFFRQKAKSLIGMAQALDERFNGEVPTDLEDLVTLPGVGRKTANVVRSVAFGLPGLPVDTHVGRLSRRLKLTTETDAVKAEHDLDALVPPEERGLFSLRLIEHGRQVCDARKPRCDICMLNELCPSAFKV
jgi:endonuclease-3